MVSEWLNDSKCRTYVWVAHDVVKFNYLLQRKVMQLITYSSIYNFACFKFLDLSQNTLSKLSEGQSWDIWDLVMCCLVSEGSLSYMILIVASKALYKFSGVPRVLKTLIWLSIVSLNCLKLETVLVGLGKLKSTLIWAWNILLVSWNILVAVLLLLHKYVVQVSVK